MNAAQLTVDAAADKNRGDDLLSPIDEANFDLWEIEIGGQR